MSYNSIALAAQDQDLRVRIAACVAQEYPGNPAHPTVYADQIQWLCCGEPGWGDAYESALAADPPNPAPGADPAVITDLMILGAVQKYPPAAPEASPV